MTSGPGFQVAIGRGLAGVFRRIEAWTKPVPEPVLGLALLALAAVFVVATLRDRGQGCSEPAGKQDPPGSPPPDGPGGGAGQCHTLARSKS